MGNLIRFPLERSGKNNITKEYGNNLTILLKDAVHLAEISAGEEVNGIFRMKIDFQNLLNKKIMEFFLKNNLCGASDLFKCSLYVSKIVSDNVVQKFKSYYAVDFLEEGMRKGNPWTFKQGADLCFILCAFFNSRKNWREMKENDYAEMGRRFYLLFYNGTKKEIGWHMSKRYKEMVMVTRYCIKGL